MCEPLKIHTLLKKEEIDTVQMNEEKIAVVFDVLMATSVIASCFHYDAKQVIPVLEATEALQEAKKYPPDEVVLIGEHNGITIEGFFNPLPSVFKKQVSGKTVILSTTNGTVAIRNSSNAKKLYVASLLNGEAVSKHIARNIHQETIIVVCSGSSNTFCLEDFYGAGYFIAQFVKEFGEEKVELTDSSLAAKLFYENRAEDSYEILRQSRVGTNLQNYHYDEDLLFVSQKGVLPLILTLEEKRLISIKKEKVANKREE